MLLGEEGMERLGLKRVAIFGIGGVGGHVVEALVRSGIGALDLIDSDTVCESNINRQIIATYETIGRQKVQVMKERIAAIHPACKVKTYECFYIPEKRGHLPFLDYDYIVDAIDTVTSKIDLAVTAQSLGIPIISCMGAGNKLDPSRLEVTDIYDTTVCPLAKIMRKELKARGVTGLKVVYSREPAMTPLSLSEKGSHRPVPGSTAFVPAVAGLLMAGEVVRSLAGICGEAKGKQKQRQETEESIHRLTID
jgi:tRNA A37 threonylcarbamoyladenosine dehydratase